MKILYFDIAAIMIVSILLMSLYFRKMLDGRVNKFLAWLLVVTLITTILDLWEESYTIWLLPKKSHTLFRYVLYYLYFFVPQSNYAALSAVYLCNYRYMAYSCEK